MELIEQMKSIVETNQSLKEENSKFTDALDEKDEEIKKLTEDNQALDIKLAQKSNEVGLQDKRLSHEYNGLKGKLAKAENINRELKEQIDQTKVNALVAKDNEIALLKQKNKELESSTSDTYDEFMKSVNKVGYVKHRLLIGRYNNDKPKYKTCFLPEDIVQHLKECPQKAPLGGRPVV